MAVSLIVTVFERRISIERSMISQLKNADTNLDTPIAICGSDEEQTMPIAAKTASRFLSDKLVLDILCQNSTIFISYFEYLAN